MKTETIKFNSFMDGSYKKKDITMKLLPIAGGYAVMVPKTVLAATSDTTFNDVLAALFGITDWLCVGVFLFAGVSWMFGNRTKGMELLIGGSIGYIIARKAVAIQQFLEAIVVGG